LEIQSQQARANKPEIRGGFAKSDELVALEAFRAAITVLD